MTIDELKRALVEVKRTCINTDRCIDCPFGWQYDNPAGCVTCRLSSDTEEMFLPLAWDVDEWEDTPEPTKEE